MMKYVLPSDEHDVTTWTCWWVVVVQNVCWPSDLWRRFDHQTTLGNVPHKCTANESIQA